MTVLRGGYVGAKTCTGSARPGVKNLMSVFLSRHADDGGKNLGIYNCRPVRGTNNTTSLHGEGRAGDHGCPVGNGWMQAWADLLVAYSAELGIQCVIYNRRIWSSSYPDGWRPYTGTVPHTDHAHVEQTHDSANTLTVARILEVIGGDAPAPRPAPPVPSVGRPTVRRGVMNNEHVRVLQDNLRRRFPAYRHEIGYLISVDGDFGPRTERWVKEYQQRAGLKVDGIVGPATWRSLGLA